MATLTKDGGRWVIRYYDESGKRRKQRTRFPTTKQGRVDALKAARGLVVAAERRRFGIQDPVMHAASESLEGHVTAFEGHLRARNPASRFHPQLMKRLRWMLRGLGVSCVGEIEAGKVERLLVILRQDGIPDRCLSSEELAGERPWHARRRRSPKSPKTRDDYLDALRQFCRWLHATQRIAKNPVGMIARQVSKLHPEATATFRRRALTHEELGRLIDAALRRGVENRLISNPKEAPERLADLQLRGRARGLAYLVAATIGIRVRALCELKWGDLDLVQGVITLRADVAKNKRETRPDLPEWLTSQLRSWRETLRDARGSAPTLEDRVFDLLPAFH
ncbi:MAG: hypothetical protein ACON4Z_11470, partial [Planctomycetota bacterium]